ncbi:5530_t:CDS:1, partial [Racocetra persica]
AHQIVSNSSNLIYNHAQVNTFEFDSEYREDIGYGRGGLRTLSRTPNTNVDN